LVKTETIPANSRKTFNMANHSGINGRAAIMVTSKTAGKPIMVERLMLAQLDYAPDPVKLDG
jgi:hypothetical protein